MGLPEAILKVQNVTKVFPSIPPVTACENVSFEVTNDEYLCIVGPSGCGKSTLLRIIAGLDSATSGAVLYHGEPITKPTPRITMIFQQFGLLPWKTALENVEIPLEVAGVEKVARHEIAMRYLGMVELEGFENVYPHDLSGGMKQRVGIARALALQPEVLLMDEPFSALDELTADNLRKLMLEIWHDPSLPTNTFIMVSHNVEEAVMLSDRIVVMSPRPGRVVEDMAVDVPRPRTDYLRDSSYFKAVDKVLEVLAQHGKPPPQQKVGTTQAGRTRM